MSKHAYIIICHNDSYCLKCLVEMIDDERNDIFIIPDMKSIPSLTKELKVKHSRLYILPKDKRVDIRWGGLSQVKAELTGMREVVSNGDYRIIHLISGVDLPIKSQDHIHSYIDSFPKAINFVGMAQGEHNKKDLDIKTNFYFPLIKYYKHNNPLIRNLSLIIRKLSISFQRLFRMRRQWPFTLYKGCNWVSITTDFAKYLVEREKVILRDFKGVFCADEIYKQTIIKNSPFRETIVDESKDFAGGTRTIDWERGKPYIWRKDDFEELLVSEGLFARKFNSSVDKDIINAIKDRFFAMTD